MIDTLIRPSEPLVPGDPMIREREGWIFGQPADETAPRGRRAHHG